MNCRDFHAECLATPNELSEAARAHMSQCTFCAESAENVRDFDRRLVTALCVSVPAYLTSRKFMEVLTREA